MKPPDDKPLARYVEVDTSPERISKIWQRISVELQLHESKVHEAKAQESKAHESEHQRTSEPPTRGVPWFAGVRLAWVGGVLAVVLALGVGLGFEQGLFGGDPWWGGAQRLHAGQGATLETNTEPLAVSMDDGSGLALAPNTKIEIDQGASEPAVVGPGASSPNASGPTGRARVAVHLSKGKVQCDVTPNPQRAFVVNAKGVEVRVTGTSFSVEVSPNQDEVRVVVKAGTVEVAPPGSAGHERRLSAGEVWAINLTAAASSAAASLAGAPPVVAIPEMALGEQAPSSGVNGGVRSVPEPGPGVDESGERARKSGPPLVVPPDPNSAQLFDQANSARREGNVAEAVRSYESLLAKFPSDGRAGLAAFELGRLRMDRLGDMSGAVTALKRAVALAPGSGFREDAMARLVQAYAAQGAKASCQSARSAYLEAYPKGVHVAAVSRKCD